ncbi:MAG: hypothetical protein Ta2B_14890 [Termitinemataceae bacterium]|nr:MAG: hypothetical protein Ta2B_14890 [Termitinemataceae bacterium]
MNTRIDRFLFLLVLFVFVSAWGMAQSNNSRMPTASQLITRIEGLAGRYETMEKKFKSETTANKISQASANALEDESVKLGNDYNYYVTNGGGFSDLQQTKWLNAQRRIQNSVGQIQRQMERWNNNQ